MDGGKDSADKEINLPFCPADVRIIVVDDGLKSLRAMSDLLEQLNYKVVPFQSATDALCALRSNAEMADLVLTDIHMPIMNGIEFMEVIRSEFQLPVILMSEDDDRRFIADSISKGALFYIFKPGRLSVLKYVWGLLHSWKCCRLLTQHQKIPDLRPSEAAMSSEAISKYLTDAYFHRDFLDCIECLLPQNVTLEGFCELFEVDELSQLTTDDVALHLQVYRACLENSENQTNVIPLANPVHQVGNNQWAGDGTQGESCGSCSLGGDDDYVADINGHVGDHSATSKAESSSVGRDD